MMARLSLLDGRPIGSAATSFLRVPPFPRSQPAPFAGTSPPLTSLLQAESSPEAAAMICRQLLENRVGGDFWAPPILGLERPSHIMIPLTLEQASAMHAALVAEAKLPSWAIVQAIVRPGPKAKQIAAWLHAQGVPVQSGPVDPWSVLDDSLSLLTSADDDFALVAQLRGLHVRRFAIAGGAELMAPQPDAIETAQSHILSQHHYWDSFTGAACSPSAFIDQLGAWRAQIDQNRAIGAAIGIAGWKRREIETFFWAGRAQPLMFHRSPARALRAVAATNGAVAAWPSRVPPSLFTDAAAVGIAVHQVEDGFIRSVGLGSGLHPPQSIVVDPVGIYYDPTCASALEQVLQTQDFAPSLIARAEALVAVIISSGISKYAAGRDRVEALPNAGRRVLVTGQVEDDRSVLLGGGDVTGNFDLLRRARAKEPDSFLIFKPHPDVEAGHRKGAISDSECLKFADLVVRDVSMAALLDAVDAVHVWTSLAGFEALLRRREVIVHGQPFFAGWGLTRDLAENVSRRTRQLSLMELVAGTLLVYPRYLDPVTNLPCTPELLISRMAHPQFQQRTLLTRIRAIQGQINRWFQ